MNPVEWTHLQRIMGDHLILNYEHFFIFLRMLKAEELSQKLARNWKIWWFLFGGHSLKEWLVISIFDSSSFFTCSQNCWQKVKFSKAATRPRSCHKPFWGPCCLVCSSPHLSPCLSPCSCCRHNSCFTRFFLPTFALHATTSALFPSPWPQICRLQAPQVFYIASLTTLSSASFVSSAVTMSAPLQATLEPTIADAIQQAFPDLPPLSIVTAKAPSSSSAWYVQPSSSSSQAPHHHWVNLSISLDLLPLFVLPLGRLHLPVFLPSSHLQRTVCSPPCSHCFSVVTIIRFFCHQSTCQSTWCHCHLAHSLLALSAPQSCPTGVCGVCRTPPGLTSREQGAQGAATREPTTCYS